MCAHQAPDDECRGIPLKDVIERLQAHLAKCPNAKVTVYEQEGDDFCEIGVIEIYDNGNELRLHSTYAVEAGLT